MEQEPIQSGVWAPSAEDLELIDRLSQSNDPLDRAYAEAYKKRCFVVEFGTDGSAGIAAVGEQDAITRLEQTKGKDIEVHSLTLGECISLGAVPGRGQTRPERVYNGVSRLEELRYRNT